MLTKMKIRTKKEIKTPIERVKKINFKNLITVTGKEEVEC